MRLILFFLPILLCAEMLKVGDRVEPAVVEDQFGKPVTIGSEQCWVITWDRVTTRDANDFFSDDGSLLQENVCRLIVDVSQTPSGIMSLFVLPRMRQYAHPILMSYDEKYNVRLPYLEGHITLLSLRDQTVSAIDFLENRDALAEALAEH